MSVPELMEEIRTQLWSVRAILDEGPYSYDKAQGDYDEHRDRIVYIKKPLDYAAVGHPFWGISDSDDRALVHYGSRYLEKRQLKELQDENRRLRSKCYYLEQMLSSVHK